MAAEQQPDQSAWLATAIRAGELVARFSITGDPASDIIESIIVIGEIASSDISYDDEFPGIPLVECETAARAKVAAQYRRMSLGFPIEVQTQARKNTSFHAHHKMLLMYPVMDAAAAAESVNGLTNNSSFADHDYRWQASAVGLLTHIRPLTRALYVATGQNEINQDQTTEPRTHPQMRADLMSYVTTAGLDAFMCMPADD